MLRSHEMKDNLTEKDVRDHLEKNGLKELVPLEEDRDIIQYNELRLKQVGLDMSAVHSINSAFSQLKQFFNTHKGRNPELEIFLEDLNQVQHGFLSVWNKALENEIRKNCKRGKATELIDQIQNACLKSYLRDNSQKFNSSHIISIYSAFMKLCEDCLGKTPAWVYTREELENMQTITLSGPGMLNKPSFVVTDSIRNKILKEQAKLDSIIQLVGPLINLTEKQVRKDLYSELQKLALVVINRDLPRFEQPWNYYFEDRINKANVCRQMVSLIAPFFGLPISVNQYNSHDERVASKAEYNDAMTKLITRRFGLLGKTDKKT